MTNGTEKPYLVQFSEKIVPGTVFALLLLALVLAAHAKSTAFLRIRNHKIIAEVADTPELRARGLMFRKSLPRDHGMLFIYPDEQIRYFWMKNTLIPLDIAFLDNNGKILTLKTMRRFNLQLVSSEKPSRYALEVNAGWFKKIHAHLDDKLKGLPAP